MFVSFVIDGGGRRVAVNMASPALIGWVYRVQRYGAYWFWGGEKLPCYRFTTQKKREPKLPC